MCCTQLWEPLIPRFVRPLRAGEEAKWKLRPKLWGLWRISWWKVLFLVPKMWCIEVCHASLSAPWPALMTIDSTCCIPKSSDLLWRNRRRVTSWPNCQSAVLWRCSYCFRRLSLWVPGEKWSWQEEVRRYLVCDPYITCHGWQCRFEAYGK